MKKGELAVPGRVERPSRRQPAARLWADAAHDLRQPVQAALLVAKTLEAEAGPADARRAAHHVATALSSLCDMLEVLTLLARIEAGLQAVPLRSCRLPEVLAPAMREMAEIAAERGMALRPPSLQGVVRSNPELLVVATRSLLLNAMKFADSDAILARCRRRGGQVRLEVHFTGDAPDGGNVKDAFVQLPPSSDRADAGALGLGLALLEQLCSRLGHALHHTRSPRGGQLLAIELPLAPASV